ncbi:MAG: hypothetical protein MI919_22430, partial [Holophagales bacterium]|nr:hypothetical protein [Holophagales bacterium]
MTGLDVCFVSMPYSAPERPSIGLSLLQAALRGGGHSCRTLYAHLAFAEQIGPGPNALRCNQAPALLLGEWP